MLQSEALEAGVAAAGLFAHGRGLDARADITSACAADRADFQLAGATRYTRLDGRRATIGSTRRAFGGSLKATREGLHSGWRPFMQQTVAASRTLSLDAGVRFE